MRVSVVSVSLALLLIGSSAAAQSPAASTTLPSVAPVASPLGPAASPAGAPLTMVAASLSAVSRKACPANATCAWYVTVFGSAMPGGAFTTGLTAEPTDALPIHLTPLVPLPTPLPAGTYLVEASSWVLPMVGATSTPKRTGRTASCATVFTVPADGSIATAELAVVFRKKNKGCGMTIVFGSVPIPAISY